MTDSSRGTRLFSRRDFCALTAASFFSLAANTSCRAFAGPNDGRLTARPRTGTKTSVAGKVLLDLNTERKAILQLPKTMGQSPVPLLVMLHGATQSADTMFRYLGSAPDEAGVAVLAPNSLGTTWDAIRDTFGVDVELLNRALERTFEMVAVDPARVVMAGFSDGASYALSLGLINGDFFKRVIAFSPGFIIERGAQGKPQFFISHGTSDHILPIDRCGRRIAQQLKLRGYEVKFREFAGDHEIPVDVAREALQWTSA